SSPSPSSPASASPSPSSYLDARTARRSSSKSSHRRCPRWPSDTGRFGLLASSTVPGAGGSTVRTALIASSAETPTRQPGAVDHDAPEGGRARPERRAAVHEGARHGEPIRALVRNRGHVRDLDEFRVWKRLAAARTLGPALDGVHRVLLISSRNPRMEETKC